MKNAKSTLYVGTILGVAFGAAAVADGPRVSPLGDETLASPDSATEAPGDKVFPQNCDEFLFDSGDSPTVNTGRTVGQPSADRWEVFQPIEFDEDVEVCGIDLDGWFVRGTPDTFDANIFPMDANGDPDVDNPLTGGPINLGGSGEVDWDSVDVAPVVLEAGVTYFFGTDSGTNNDHWSAIFRDASLNGQNSFSIRNGTDRFDSVPIALRIRGSSASCLDMTVSDLIGGRQATWTISGATPNSSGAVVFGFEAGETVVDDQLDFCATFGIDGVNQNRLVGLWNADGNGEAEVRRNIPNAAVGRTVFTQAAERGTCPDECTSGVDEQVVR